MGDRPPWRPCGRLAGGGRGRHRRGTFAAVRLRRPMGQNLVLAVAAPRRHRAAARRGVHGCRLLAGRTAPGVRRPVRAPRDGRDHGGTPGRRRAARFLPVAADAAMNRLKYPVCRAAILLVLLSAAPLCGEAGLRRRSFGSMCSACSDREAVELAAVDAATVSVDDGAEPGRVLSPRAVIALSRDGERVRAVMAGQDPADGRGWVVTPAAPDGRIEVRLANGFRRVFRGSVAVATRGRRRLAPARGAPALR